MTVTSRTVPSGPARTRSIAPRSPPAAPMAAAICGEAAGRRRQHDADGEAVRRRRRCHARQCRPTRRPRSDRRSRRRTPRRRRGRTAFRHACATRRAPDLSHRLLTRALARRRGSDVRRAGREADDELSPAHDGPRGGRPRGPRAARRGVRRLEHRPRPASPRCAPRSPSTGSTWRRAPRTATAAPFCARGRATRAPAGRTASSRSRSRRATRAIRGRPPAPRTAPTSTGCAAERAGARTSDSRTISGST